MNDLRQAIQEGAIQEYRKLFWRNYEVSDQTARINQKYSRLSQLKGTN